MSQHDSGPAPTDQLLEWASNLKFADLPADGVEMLRDDLVDGLGAALFGSTLPASKTIRSVVAASGDTGPCQVWGAGVRTSPIDAVVANAASLNGFELDDYCGMVRGVHGAMTVYPAILAIASLTGNVTGQDVLAAAAAGWETSTRVSVAMGPTVLDRGFYMTPMYATLGSAVAAGRALHLTPEQMKGAFTMALLHSSGLAITTEEGIGKPLSSGEAVRSGVLCALLAAQGAAGPRNSYEAPRKGFAAVFGKADERNDEALIVKPGDKLASQDIRFKAYATCGAGQVVTDILSDIMRTDPDITPATVASVQLRINATGAGHIGAPYVPRDATNAQFNLAYCVAAQLLEGHNSADQFRSELLADPRILDITSRVEVIPDPTVGVRATNFRNEAYVSVRLTDGTIREGHAEKNRPMDRTRLRAKFAGLAAHAVTADAADSIVALVEQIESVPNAAQLDQLLIRNSDIQD